ncbi:MAG: hypothetical protein V1674_03185 [Candidatus Omnitrophota bacterium]
MKKIIILWFVFLFVTSIGFAQDTATPATPQQSLVLTIKSDKQVYEVGGGINIRAEIINISDKPVKVSDYYNPIDFVVYLNNEYGQKCILNYSDVLRRIMPVEIKPHESINTDGVTFNLPNNVTEHENYKIMGKHSIYMVDGKLTSNTITIEVKEKKKQSSATIYKFAYDCTELRKQIYESIEEANYCHADSDCIISKTPFGCYHLFNKDADLALIRNKIERYKSLPCALAAYECTALPESEDIKCQKSKCAVIK